MEIGGGVTPLGKERMPSQFAEYASSDGSGKMDELCPVEADGSAGKEELPLPQPKLVVKRKGHSSRSFEDYPWEEKVLQVLFILRWQRICEYDPKKDDFIPIHFCNHNIAFFDFKRESEIGRGLPLHKLAPSQLKWMEDSVNVISLKILQSDVGYPISVYGTVVARDQIDYRCVYLFRRDRDDSQIITSPRDMLTLTGPDRGLGVTDSMFFEINLKVKDLKIKDVGTVDKDFSKGVIEHSAIFHTKQPRSCLLNSWLSTVEFVYTPVPWAVEAALTFNILNGLRNFSGKVTAWTTEDDRNHIILYDSEAAGTLTATTDDGFVALSRCLVAVPLDEKLVLNIRVIDGDPKDEHIKLFFGLSDEECVCKIGAYVLKVKVTWTGGMIRRRRRNMWEHIGGLTLLR